MQRKIVGPVITVCLVPIPVITRRSKVGWYRTNTIFRVVFLVIFSNTSEIHLTMAPLLSLPLTFDCRDKDLLPEACCNLVKISLDYDTISPANEKLTVFLLTGIINTLQRRKVALFLL